MDDIDRRVIQVYIEILSNETNFKGLWESLAKNTTIFTPYLAEKYQKLQQNGTGNYELNKTFYTDIQSRGKTAFDSLLLSLRDIHPHLAELLSLSEIMPTHQEENTVYENEDELTEYKGNCSLKIEQNWPELIPAVKNLCQTIKAKFVSSDENLNLTSGGFHFAIKSGGKFEEEDIKEIESFYTDNSNFKIIMLNIISGKVSKPKQHRARNVFESFDRSPAPVFIVDIHIHQGDHVPSIINIVKEVISHNTSLEIRNIFRVVMEKVAKWGCRLDTESRSFPEFFF